MASSVPAGSVASAFRPLWSTIRLTARAAVDVLMPPTCVSCKAPVTLAHLHCADCWAGLLPPAGTRCAICSVTLPRQWAAEAVCLGCLQSPPPFRRARAPFRYADVARQTVLAFKNGAEHLAPMMARAMLADAAALGPETGLAQALVVPVPLHRWRLARRGYNQAAWLARAIATQTGAPLAVDALARVRPTPSTRGLGRAARAAAVAGAFVVQPPQRARVAGAHILLVDDVLTTGATAAAASRALRAAGATTVDVLTYARVAADDAGAYAAPSVAVGN